MKLEQVSNCVSSKRFLALAGAAAVVAIGTGCETKSWLDPSEVGRYQKTPLVVPILDKLVVGVEAEELKYAGARDVTADDLSVQNRDYRVGPNDLIQYTIQDLTGAGTITQDNKRVSESGKVSLPYLGQISVVGMTEAEIEDAIVKAYAEAQILPKAIVSVSVVESQNRIYSISGAITQPGSYPLLRGDLRLLDAVANARGATSETGVDYVYIIRHRAGATGGTNGGTPATAPGTTGRDPLAPTSLSAPAPAAPIFAVSMQDAQPTPQTPEEARAAAERLANELRQSRADGTAATSAPAAAEPAPAASADDANRRDHVIQIEGAGTQPASPNDSTITTIPPSMGSTPADAGNGSAMGGTGMNGGATGNANATSGGSGFEFTAPAEPTDQEIIKVPFAALKRGELKYNVVIQPQDMIIVPYPTFGTYYMGGHVLRTGAYNLPPDGMTLKQAIDSAGGLDQLAIPARTEVIRRVGPNQEMFVRVDLERIFTGLEPDIYLKANDSVRVGTNLGATFAAALRNAFRITYGFGFLYDRNYAPAQSGINGR